MATRVVDTDLDFSGVGKIIRALLNPVSSDPGSPANGEVWYNTTASRLKVKTAAGVVSLATTADVTGGAITGSLWDAQSVVVAVTDDTPVAQTLAAGTVLGRRNTGNITAVTYANLLADLETLGISAEDLGGMELADVLDRGNHINTQTASTISDFNTAVDARVAIGTAALIDSAPGTLDTLNELAAAIGDDANFASTVTTALGLRTKKFAGNYGNGSLTAFTVNHALSTTDVVVSVFVNSTGEEVDAQVRHTDANNCTVTVNTVYASNALRIVVIG
jgi:hypothetical protein